MEDKEVFVALRDFKNPNCLANYSAHLSKDLERKVFLYGLTRVPLITPPVTMHQVANELSPISSVNDVKDTVEDKLQLIYKKAFDIYPHINYSLDVGLAEPSIIAKVEDKIPYLVLVEGNNELTTLHEWFGTYETRLAENIDVPVLVVPQDHNWKAINKILYIMDMDDHKVENIRFLTDMAEKLKASVSVVVITDDLQSGHENKKYELTKDVLTNLLGYYGVDFHRIVKEESAETVEGLMGKINADWLAFEHRSKSFFERMLNDYNTKRLILQADKPVLVF